ncbi:interferon-gamma-inducible GTPase 10-like isoform X2 [Eucyclogobius newberryi]|uniref:interferon-gamma-inducible GTPase 10-like isoform X2 n=1 Tax=Eucyclogobius newberryi TaxID=166745 RepID=UPI003B59172D
MDNFHEETKYVLQNNDQAAAAKLAKEHLENLDKVPLTIAVTGETGSGKSTFVNALRGLKNSDEGAAPTGAVETTMEPTEYLHPDYPNVKIWDLPGMGTIKFTADKYLKKMEFEKFDFFIIVSADRFSENDAKLAREIQNLEKKFYFVRSKIDHNIIDEKRDKKEFNEEETLKRIRDDCIQGLEQLEIKSPKVFLVSGKDLNLFDADDLWKLLEQELPEHKREVLLLALPNISLDVINRKKQALKDKIQLYALASAIGAAVLIPGISIAVDLAIITKFVTECQKSLGLRAESLKRLSEATGVSMEELKAEIKSPLTGVKITTELVIGVLRGCIFVGGLMAAEEGARFVPFIGTPVAMGLSAFSTYLALKYLLKSLGDDAQRVFAKAMGLTDAVSD